MSLNIKNPEAHELAKALQRETGESMTHAVTEALRERLARVRRRSQADAMLEDILEIGRRCAAEPDTLVIDHADLLYDENGLPR